MTAVDPAFDTFRQGAIQCQSTATDTYVRPGGSFDLVVVTSSWDERALVVPSLPLAMDVAVVVTFENRGSSGRRETHDAELMAWSEEHASEVRAVHGASENILTMWRQLQSMIAECRKAAARPLRVMFDLSTCPRYLALAALQACIGTGVASEIVFTYAEAQYPVEEKPIDRYEMFTSGRWETLAVPGLVGRYDPALARHYVVAVGFEGSKTRRVVMRADPDKVTALFPDPAVEPAYVKRTMANNLPMFTEWGIAEGDLVRAGAADVIGAAQALVSSGVLVSEANLFFLCAGTKPHALAMGLLALTVGTPAVLYVKPASHKEVHITPRGTYWTYTVTDVTVAPPVRSLRQAT